MVIIKLQGNFTNRSASVDGQAVQLTGTSTVFTGKASVAPGKHRLEWAVQGIPGTTYSVALSGDAGTWSSAGLVFANDGYGYGFRRFEVKP